MTDDSPPPPRKFVPVANSDEQRKQTALLEAILAELQSIGRKLAE
jgi:hypothetical protein